MNDVKASNGGWTEFPTPAGAIKAFEAKPEAAPPWPALIVIHGVNGLGLHMLGNCREFASWGYLAVAPDIYSHDPHFKSLDVPDIEAAAHMGKDPARHGEFLANFPPERQMAIRRAREWISARPAHTYIDIVSSCYEYLRSRADIRSIACLGYCMGGRLAGELASAGAELSAAIVYYGAPPSIDLVRNIRCPIEGHYASADHGITDKVPQFAAAMKAANKDFSYHVYDAKHGFSLSPDLHSYDAQATALSLTRIRTFLDRSVNASTHGGAGERKVLIEGGTSERLVGIGGTQ